MTPVRLTPRLLEKVWGSTTLEPWFPNQKEKTGEVWFELKEPEGVPGLPLLIKFLFTSEKLSVQVHPNDEQARLHHGSRGKTEMWHVLRAAPGAQIAAGFRREISEQELRDAARSGDILQLLAWHDAHVGDTFFIPAGTVHTIGEGLVLCEIQQNSDVTYRLFDYGRPRRELHLDEAARVIHRGPHVARTEHDGRMLACCEYFATEKIELAGTERYQPAPGRAEWLIVLEGEAAIANQPTRAGEVWYVAPKSPQFEVRGDAVLLRTSAPV